MQQFNGQVAVVTGGASGIGWAVAEQLARAGATVVIADLNSAAAEAKAEQLRRLGHRARATKLDVSAACDVDRWIAEVVALEGVPEILVHSAGIGVERLFLDTTIEEWERIVRVDLTGTFLVSQAVARYMVRARYGRIVVLASTAGLRGGFGRAAYGSAKGGVIALAQVMAVELAGAGITVNALAPGAIDTELVAVMHSPQTRQIYRSRIPLDRYGTPAETAAAAVFLCSREAAYITGHVLAVDGGFLAAGLMDAGIHQNRKE